MLESPSDYRLRYDVARLYEIVGARDKFMKIAKEIEPIALEQIQVVLLCYRSNLSELFSLRTVAHGVLHLVGYDDKTRRGKLGMRIRENYYIKKAGF